MRIAVYVALVVLAVSAVLSGQLAVALGIAGVKTLLVGGEYMELRMAHRGHALGFALGVVVMVFGLIGLAG